jgi:DNA-binding MarR family transcriptional regulator
MKSAGAAGAATGPAKKTGGDANDATRSAVSLWVRLLESHNLMLGEIRRRLADHATMPRFDLLANLEREDGQTLAALSRSMLVTAGNLTGLVDRAERDGDVERRNDPSDRRLSRVHLTPKGRALITSLLPAHAEHVSELVGGLDAAERRELRRLLGKLRESLASRFAPKYGTSPAQPERGQQKRIEP